MLRRTFIEALVTGLTIPARVFGQAPAVVTSESARPRIDFGVGAGDPMDGRAVVWAHVDRPARMVVEYSTRESFKNLRRVEGGVATPDTGLTARTVIGDLAPGQDVFYRVMSGRCSPR